MRETPIFITDDAVLNIYIIGYNVMGESILFEIKDKDAKIYGLIDCYKENGLNKTFDMLKERDVTELYFLLWSHPDRDHSLGLEDIIEHFGDKIRLFGISEGISLEEINSTNNNRQHNDVENVYRVINEVSKSLGLRFVYINHSIREFKIPFLKSNGENIDFKIKPFAPLCNIVRENRIKIFKNIQNNETSQILKNKISTGFLITLGDYNLCFAGDITNEGLLGDDYKKYLKNLFKDIDFVKIPHHGSKSSDKFLNLLPKNFNYAGVTKFQTTAPNPDIISMYKNRTRNFLATFPINIQPDNYESDCGIIKLTIPFDNISYVNHELIGNASTL